MADPPRPDVLERVRILAAHGHDARGLAKAVSVGAPAGGRAARRRRLPPRVRLRGGGGVLRGARRAHRVPPADHEPRAAELVLGAARRLRARRRSSRWMRSRSPTRRRARCSATILPSGLLTEARGWPAVIGLAAMRGVVDVAADMKPDELYRFFAEDLFRSASPALRDAMFRLALAGDAAIDAARALLGTAHAQLVDEAAERGFLVPAAGRRCIRCCAASCSRSSPSERAPRCARSSSRRWSSCRATAVGRLPLRARAVPRR